MEVLNDPIAQELIWSPIPAHVAYTALDGTPRVVPRGFHWNGTEFVICTVPHSPKVKALASNPHVALTIDTVEFPPHVLLVRGTAALEQVPGVPPEYLEAARKQIGAEGMPAFEAQVREQYSQMTRIRVTPTWANVLDFETRLPTPVEQLVKELQASGR